MTDTSPFYITTAISYPNGKPHIGHAYELIATDAVARYQRLDGRDVFFLTGTDEHGQKIAHAAAAAGKEPRAFVDEIAKRFVATWKTLNISNDKFVRTSDPRHALAVQELFRRLWDAHSPKTGQPVLFESDYEGLYCEGCEAFKQEKDLDAKGRCPEHKKAPRKIRETNFFFRLSEYDEALLKHLEAHPDGTRRQCLPDHLTASAIVVDPDRGLVLLGLHAKAKLWLQMGGHIDAEDGGIAAAALRESVGPSRSRTRPTIPSPSSAIMMTGARLMKASISG